MPENIKSLIKLFDNRGKASQAEISRQIYLFNPNKTDDLTNDMPSTIPTIPRLPGTRPNLPIIPKVVKIRTSPDQL